MHACTVGPSQVLLIRRGALAAGGQLITLIRTWVIANGHSHVDVCSLNLQSFKRNLGRAGFKNMRACPLDKCQQPLLLLPVSLAAEAVQCAGQGLQ